MIYGNIEDLFRLPLQSLSRGLKKKGLSLGRAEDRLSRSPGESIDGECYWGDSSQRRASLGYSLKVDERGLYILFSYTVLHKDKEWEVLRRFDLVKKESNLIPGKYRYYFRDPESEGGQLCTKLFIFQGELHTLRTLQTLGFIYSQQRESHIGREVWIPYYRSQVSIPKYMKKTYRGKETPRYSRLIQMKEKGEERLEEYLLWKNLPEFMDLIPRKGTGTL